VLDSFDDVERLERIATDRNARQAVLIRVTPGVAGRTHDKISTGQADSKFGFGLDDARRAIERLRGSDALELRGVHMHLGSQLLSLDAYRPAVEAIAALGDFPVYNLGGGLGVAYTAGQQPPSIEDVVETQVKAADELLGRGKRLLMEPGRSLVANACVTLYTVETVKRNVSTWVGVDGGMSDNLRPMLYGSVYEAFLADRAAAAGSGDRVHVAGKHCESGDVIVRDVPLDDPRPGDVLVTPATGAYGHAMANNYNGIPRPPVIFCKDGDARVVVRRETYEDLAARDVG
jgi:diaminopimelate decarboxylase